MIKAYKRNKEEVKEIKKLVKKLNDGLNNSIAFENVKRFEMGNSISIDIIVCYDDGDVYYDLDYILEIGINSFYQKVS